MENKYIITCWASYFDYDGMYNDFKILAVCKTREESFKKLDILADKVVKDEIKKQKKKRKNMLSLKYQVIKNAVVRLKNFIPYPITAIE